MHPVTLHANPTSRPHKTLLHLVSTSAPTPACIIILQGCMHAYNNVGRKRVVFVSVSSSYLLIKKFQLNRNETVPCCPVCRQQPSKNSSSTPHLWARPLRSVEDQLRPPSAAVQPPHVTPFSNSLRRRLETLVNNLSAGAWGPCFFLALWIRFAWGNKI